VTHTLLLAALDVAKGTGALVVFGLVVLAIHVYLNRRRSRRLWSTSSATFQSSDVGKTYTYGAIQAGTTITAVVDHCHVTILPPGTPVFHDWADETDSIEVTRSEWDDYLSVPRAAS
jgi:hypothetical protein